MSGIWRNARSVFFFLFMQIISEVLHTHCGIVVEYTSVT